MQHIGESVSLRMCNSNNNGMQFTVSFSPREPEFPFAQSAPPFSANSVGAVNADAYRKCGLGKRNGAFAVR
ncbi:MAG: hypothetical protein K5882_06570 [Bacteroidales bacterium]|nr:hypothetical protein [Bacteroidales bacterium]